LGINHATWNACGNHRGFGGVGGVGRLAVGVRAEVQRAEGGAFKVHPAPRGARKGAARSASGGFAEMKAKTLEAAILGAVEQSEKYAEGLAYILGYVSADVAAGDAMALRIAAAICAKFPHLGPVPAVSK
jgi:hypothetical protein